MKKLSFLLMITSLVLLSFSKIQEAKIYTTPKLVQKQSPPIKVQFPSLDSINITANIYEIDKESPVIVLCHQAGFNKFEYNEIALELNNRGFNCIAIDQRSGAGMTILREEAIKKNIDIDTRSEYQTAVINYASNTNERPRVEWWVNFPNETKLDALKHNKPTNGLDAEQDIIAAINYASNRYEKPVILWGSSYSATLVLYIAIENNKVSSVVSFSPGNYYAEAKGSLIEKLKDFKKPFFITSSKKEVPSVNELLKEVELKGNQIQFVPTGLGYHGSRALWKPEEESEAYWKSLDSFLKKLK